MPRVRRAAMIVLPLLVAACGADPSPQPAQRTIGALTGPSVSTDLTAYAAGATITVTYDGLPGNPKDWIAIAPAGSSTTSYVAFVFTDGQTSGTATFSAPTAGTYVARAFSDNTYTLVAESPSLTVVTISTDQSSYSAGSTITVTYDGLPGNLKDWIAIAPAGSSATSYLAFVFTNGQTSGTATFTAPAPGTYVARTFSNNTYTLLGESPSFTTTISISTDQSTYMTGSSTITVTYAGLPGNQTDWIAIAPAGSSATTYVAFVYTNRQISGTATFTAPTAGTYVARAFSSGTFTVLAESPSFTVTTPTISTDAASYPLGATITVTYAGLPGNAKDWIAIAAPASNDGIFVDWVYTNGQVSGTATFAAPASGVYAARAFLNDTTTRLAQSSMFAVGDTTTIATDKASYPAGSTVTVRYMGLPSNQKFWIGYAVPGAFAALDNFVAINGQGSGTTTFRAPNAQPSEHTFEVRALLDGTFALLAKSPSFTTVAPTFSTDKTSYRPGSTIFVTYAGMPGNAADAITLVASPFAYFASRATNGQTSGTVIFTAPSFSSTCTVRAQTTSPMILTTNPPVTITVSP